ncbi:hypothetical protein [Brachybacterium hainanense]|uniref:Uncharacterized protein n=1 Tax=Brachybacterium hainanense TaxID=1541174 RepID=A0ABV6R937_9MICO
MTTKTTHRNIPPSARIAPEPRDHPDGTASAGDLAQLRIDPSTGELTLDRPLAPRCCADLAGALLLRDDPMPRVGSEPAPDLDEALVQAPRNRYVQRAARALRHIGEGRPYEPSGVLAGEDLARLCSTLRALPGEAPSGGEDPGAEPILPRDASALLRDLLDGGWLRVDGDRIGPGPVPAPPEPGADPIGHLDGAHRLLVSALFLLHGAETVRQRHPSSQLTLAILPMACRPCGVRLRDPWGAEVARDLWEAREEWLVRGAQVLLEDVLEDLVTLREMGVLDGDGLLFTGSAPVRAAVAEVAQQVGAEQDRA